MSDVLYKVRTVYETDASKAGQGAAQAAAGVSVLGRVTEAAKAGLRTMFNTAMVAGAIGLTAAVGTLAYGITNLNAQAESTAVGIAGMVNAAGATNASGGIASWGESMQFAEQTMVQIRRDAAALPGEAEDFVEVFRAGLAPALEAGMRASDVAQFTNRFAAVGISFRVDAPQIGRDLNLMLQGRAGAHVNMWNRLKSTIGLTAAQFNALTAAQRQARIDEAIRRYDNMIGAFGNTWEAVSSTTVSYFKELARFGSRPMFDALKNDLRDLNSWWDAHQHQIQEVAHGIGTSLADAYHGAGEAAAGYIHRFDNWSRTQRGQAVMNGASNLWDRAREGARTVAGGVRANAGALIGAAAGRGLSLAGAGAGASLGVGVGVGAFVQFLSHTEAAASVFMSLNNVLGSVLSIVATVVSTFTGLEAMLGGLLAGALPGLWSGIDTLMHGFDDAFKALGPALNTLFDALSPVVSVLGAIIGETGSLVGSVLSPAVRAVGSELARFVTALAGAIRWINQQVRPYEGFINRASTWMRDNVNAPLSGVVSVLAHAPGRLTQIAGRDSAAVMDRNLPFRDIAADYRAGVEWWRRTTDVRPDSVTPASNSTTPDANAPGFMDRLRDTVNGLRRTLEERPNIELGQGRAGRAVQQPGRPVVNVHIHQTINTADDPDRVLLMTRRAVVQGIYAPVESPGVRITR